MKRAGASRGKFTGLYLRGKTFWFTYRLNGKKKFHSLGTVDYGEAVQKALEIRQNPELAPAVVFAREIEAFIAHKLARSEYSKRSAGVKVHALKELAAATGRANPIQVTAADVTTFYRRLQGRVAEFTAQGYVVTARSFFNWLVAEGKMRRNPVAKVRLDRYDQKGRDKFCTSALRDQLIASATADDLKLILFLGFHAGLRKNEIIEARPEWFDLERGLLTFNETKTFRPKDREQRTMPLTGAFKTFLPRYGLLGPFVLHPEVKHGKSVCRYDFKKSFATHMKANGCPWVTPHIMRGTRLRHCTPRPARRSTKSPSE